MLPCTRACTADIVARAADGALAASEMKTLRSTSAQPSSRASIGHRIWAPLRSKQVTVDVAGVVGAMGTVRTTGLKSEEPYHDSIRPMTAAKHLQVICVTTHSCV